MNESFAISTRAGYNNRTFAFYTDIATCDQWISWCSRSSCHAKSGSFFSIGQNAQSMISTCEASAFLRQKSTQLGNRLNMWAICKWKCIEEESHRIRIKQSDCLFLRCGVFSFFFSSSHWHRKSMSTVAPISHPNTIFIVSPLFVVHAFFHARLRCEVAISMAP